MANYASILLIHLFFCFLLANGNEINQLYMSVQHDVVFKPIVSDYMIQTSTFIDKILCPSMCLTILGCQLVMYNSIDSSCTIYNSTNGQFNTVTGYITYIAADAMMTTTTITTTTTEAGIRCATKDEF